MFCRRREWNDRSASLSRGRLQGKIQGEYVAVPFPLIFDFRRRLPDHVQAHAAAVQHIELFILRGGGDGVKGDAVVLKSDPEGIAFL